MQGSEPGMKLLGGQIAWVKHRLHLAVEQKVAVKNETDLEIDWDWEENCDGSKPSIIVKIKAVFLKGVPAKEFKAKGEE